MSVSVETVGSAAGPNVRVLSAMVGVAAVAGAAGLVTYGAYGDPHPKANQESGVPFIIIVSAVVAALVFGLLGPKALKAIRSGEAGTSRWALGYGIAAVVSCAVFWSGIPLVLGAAGALVAGEGTRAAEAGVPTRRRFTIALGLSVLAMAAAVTFTVLGNTLLSHF